MNQTIVDPKRAADLLGVCRNTVYELLRTGQLDYFKVGSTYRIDVAAIDRYKTRNGKTGVQTCV